MRPAASVAVLAAVATAAAMTCDAFQLVAPSASFRPELAPRRSPSALFLYAEDVMDRTLTRDANTDEKPAEAQQQQEDNDDAASAAAAAADDSNGKKQLLPHYVIDTTDKSYIMHKDYVPELQMLRDWTVDYFQRMEECGGLTHIEQFQDLLADDHIQTGPDIGPINKEDLVSLYSYYNDNGMDFTDKAVPDLTVHASGWHQDPHNPWRIWVVVRYEGTHTASVQLPSFQQLSLSPDSAGGTKFMTGPELQSFVWTPRRKILWKTVGGAGDPYTGSNEGLGDIDGLLVSLGLPRLVVETWKPVRKVSNWMSQFRSKQDPSSPTASEPRRQTPYSELPQWWHDRNSQNHNLVK